MHDEQNRVMIACITGEAEKEKQIACGYAIVIDST